MEEREEKMNLNVLFMRMNSNLIHGAQGSINIGGEKKSLKIRYIDQILDYFVFSNFFILFPYLFPYIYIYICVCVCVLFSPVKPESRIIPSGQKIIQL